MCVICQSFTPWSEDCSYAPLPTEDDRAPDLAAPTSVWTYDQIAQQLTDGFWSPYGGQRAFDVAPGGTLFVDMTNLTANGQAMARQALDAWTVVTGIRFSEIDADSPPLRTWSEASDAPDTVTTPYTMSVGDDFLGTLSTGFDRDDIAIQLTAGQAVRIEHVGDPRSGNATADPFLWLLNSSGTVVAQNDDAIGRDSFITYQAMTTGTFYIRAGSFDDSNPGDYRISVREEGAVADIVFDDAQSGAYASSIVSGGVIQSSFVNINAAWAGGSNRTDGYYFQTYIHEIGHALGLGHAGNYNGSATYSSDALFYNDSWQSSVMSYFHQTENSWLDASFAYAITPMMADIIAIQNLYGTPQSNTGDTIYGVQATTGTYLDQAADLSNPVSYTLVDTDGRDTIDFSTSTAHQRLDLRPETYSDLDGLRGNIGIARGTVIENGLTGGGNDTIIGNDANNMLSAGIGNDRVEATDGNDVILGGAGADTLLGGDGFDFIESGSGNNRIDGGTGGDLLVSDTVTLDILTMAIPGWMPPPNAQELLDKGDYMTLWEDILTQIDIA